MTYIITNANPNFSNKGVTAEDVLKRSGDALKDGNYPLSSTAASEESRMDHFQKTGNSSASGPAPSQNLTKQANILSNYGGSGVSYTAPSFYSPIHTPVNWQIPTRRREVYLWSRFFAQNDPTIKASLRFYSQFPFHGYDHVISDPIRKEHFDNLKKRLQLEKLLPQIAYEYFAMGDVFPFTSISCSDCGGFGTKQDGSPCGHKHGRIGGITVLNPDWVDVQINPLMSSDPVVSLVPDDTIKQIVTTRKPPEIYNKIPEQLRNLIMQGKPIPMSNMAVTHMKHDEIPYMAYGNSIIAPLFPILAYQDRLRQAQWIVAERHILPIKVCKIGSDTRPAGAADIADTQRQLATTANDPNLTLVTHHNFSYEWVGAAGKVLQLTKEYDLIDQALIKGLGVNEALLSGTGPSYSQAAIGIEATIKRLRTVQNLLSWWIKEKIYRLEAQMQGFYKKDLEGNKVLDYPDIKWADLNLRDETQKQQLYMQMWDKQLVSSQFIHEKFGIDHDTETERIRMEQAYQMQLGISPGGEGGGKPGGGLLGGGFGGGGGAAPAGPKGNLPGGQSAPGLPGDANAPSMSGGGPPAGGGEPMGAYETQLRNYNQATQVAPSITRKPRIKEPKPPRVHAPLENEQIEIPRTGSLALTDIEIALYAKIEEAQKQGHLPLEFLWQTNPEPNDPETSRIVADGIFPSIKLIVEADGKKWHSSPEDILRDQERDQKLIAKGWNILRFTEDEIKYSINDVIKKIIRTVEELTSNDKIASNARIITGGYKDDLCYSERINKYKEEEISYKLFNESNNEIDENFITNSQTYKREIEAEKIDEEDFEEENKKNPINLIKKD